MTVTVAEGPCWFNLCACKDGSDEYVVPNGIEFTNEEGKRSIDKVNLQSSCASDDNNNKKAPLRCSQSNKKETVDGCFHDDTANSKRSNDSQQIDEESSDSSNEYDERSDDEDHRNSSSSTPDKRESANNTNTFNNSKIHTDVETHEMASNDEDINRDAHLPRTPQKVGNTQGKQSDSGSTNSDSLLDEEDSVDE